MAKKGEAAHANVISSRQSENAVFMFKNREEALNRRDIAVSMRRNGMTFAQIAASLKISRSRAQQLFLRGIEAPSRRSDRA